MHTLTKVWIIENEDGEEIMSATVSRDGCGLEINSDCGVFFIPATVYEHMALILKEVIKERDEA